MAGTTYCRWYDKRLADVFEWEQEQCLKNGLDCGDCPDLICKEDSEKEFSND